MLMQHLQFCKHPIWFAWHGKWQQSKYADFRANNKYVRDIYVLNLFFTVHVYINYELLGETYCFTPRMNSVHPPITVHVLSVTLQPMEGSSNNVAQMFTTLRCAEPKSLRPWLKVKVIPWAHRSQSSILFCTIYVGGTYVFCVRNSCLFLPISETTRGNMNRLWIQYLCPVRFVKYSFWSM